MSFIPLFRNVLLTGIGVIVNMQMTKSLNEKLGTQAYFLAVYDPQLDQRERLIQLAKFVGVTAAVVLVAAFVSGAITTKVDQTLWPKGIESSTTK